MNQKYGYDEKEQALNEDVTFAITCTMRKRWAPPFVSALKKMEEYGSSEMSRFVSIYADGEQDFHPKFECDVDFPEVAPSSNVAGDCVYDPG